jgi:hypothetical protein
MERNRKTSPELQKHVNPGPASDAKITDIGNRSGRPNMSIPTGRSGLQTTNPQPRSRINNLRAWF